MIRFHFTCARAAAALVLVSASAVSYAQSAPQGSGGNGLKIIDNPGGGRIVYGQLVGQTSKADAMVLVLRKVHTEFGDRPELGKFFQSKDGDSIATFFTVTARTQGNKSVAGLAIVHMPAGVTPSAAVLYDDAGRFGRTEPVMMQKLNDAWKTDGGGNTASSASNTNTAPSNASAAAPVARTGALAAQESTAGDRSAYIKLAPGWQIKNVNAGALGAEGPNGENLALGLMVIDIRDPNGPRGGFPGQPPPIVCPFGGNLFDAYVCVANQRRRNNNLPQASFKFVRMVPTPNDATAGTVFFELNRNDGKGLRKGSALVREFRNGGGAQAWYMLISTIDAPAAIADAEHETMMAMANSFRQDQAVIDQETKNMIASAHATQAQMAAQKVAFDQHMQNIDRQSAAFSQHMQNIDHQSAAFSQHMDNIDRSSKAFQNYSLDQSVMRDTDTGARGTISNTYADALVNANPDRFQVVQNQDLIKGRDY